MNQHIVSIIIGFGAFVCLSGCSKEPQPSQSDIERTLAIQLPAFARISNVSVEAIQNMGTKVDPAWHARFRGTVKVTVDTFVQDGADVGVAFLRAVKREGETSEVFGKSISKLYAGAWQTNIEFEGRPIEALGQPASAFATKKAIVRGSNDETAYLAEQAEKQRVAAIEAGRLAQIKAEQEKKAQAMFAEAEEKKRQDTAKAEEKKRQGIAKAPTRIIGQWRDEGSFNQFNADGTYIIKFDAGGDRRGKWVIDGDMLDLEGFHRWQILEFDDDTFVMQRSGGGETCRQKRVK